MPFRESLVLHSKARIQLVYEEGYIAVGGSALLPPGMKDLLKEDLNKGFSP